MMMTPAEIIPHRIEIPQFPGGKRIAVTTSWDDGPAEDRHLIQAFNQWGLKGTFNLNSGALSNGKRGDAPTIDVTEVASLYAGHEVAIHTVTHPFLDRLDASQIATEVLDDRKALEDLVGYPVRGMAYPFGTYNARVIEVLRALGIVYCRTVANCDPCFPPADPLAWGTTSHQFGTTSATVPQLWEKLYSKPNSAGVFFIWGHAYEFNRTGHTWAELEPIFKPLAQKPDVWYCTNIELFDYESARQRIAIAANRRSAFNPSAITVSLNIDGKLIEIPGGKTIALS